MGRRRSDLQGLDVQLWPTVDPGALSTSERTTFLKRSRAIELYTSGVPVRTVERQTGVPGRQIYRLLDRCLAQSDDGALNGFRGLIKYRRIAPYTRQAVVRATDPNIGCGLAGAFVLLLDRYPVLATWLRKQIRDRNVFLEQLRHRANIT